MWPWQRNGEQPSHTLVRRLLFLTTFGHIGLLMCLFVFYHSNVNNVSPDVIAVLLDMDVTVVRVPLTKVMHKSAPVVGSGKKTVAAAAAPALKEALPETGLSKPKEQKKAVSKSKKAQQPKKAAKPKKEKPKPAKVEPKKVESKKIEEKKPEPKPQPVVAQHVEPVTDQISQEELIVGENVVYVGQHEYEALEVQRQIQQEAQKWWKAPPGIGADVACQVVVHIDHEGKVHDLNIAKESGVLMFDVRARQAVSQMEFPRGSWGKEVVVYFKQS